MPQNTLPQDPLLLKPLPQDSLPKGKPHLLDDILLILTMAVLAGCGLIYEYLLSHYAGRVLGVMESTIYTMIGLMIVSMGLGAFAAIVYRSKQDRLSYI